MADDGFSSRIVQALLGNAGSQGASGATLGLLSNPDVANWLQQRHTQDFGQPSLNGAFSQAVMGMNMMMPGRMMKPMLFAAEKEGGGGPPEVLNYSSAGLTRRRQSIQEPPTPSEPVPPEPQMTPEEIAQIRAEIEAAAAAQKGRYVRTYPGENQDEFINYSSAGATRKR